MGPEVPSHDLAQLQKALKALTTRAEFPVAFGGLVTRDGAPLTSFVGTRGQSLNGLLIEPSQGLGGRAISERRPVTATQYRHATTITHRYDREVLAEDIVSLLAIPVVVDGSVRAVIYGGHRLATQFGDTVVRQSLAVAKGLAWEYSVHDEVERRVAVLETEGGLGGSAALDRHERDELRELYAELREISRTVTDPEVARRLGSVGRALGAHSIAGLPLTDIVHPGDVQPSANRSVESPVGGLRPSVDRGVRDSPSLALRAEPTSQSATDLSPRELDVLAHVALGKRNSQIGVQLNLAESTVKSYLSSAMRKLDATGRFDAVLAARRRGLIP
ncbi:LuxR C-terminal-related transcriptional regulator [Subtercola frigoramans]|uniref:DNA-binding CsgD family transcriptional regulator n=1 Tax=Subtercola frigoramans TaxID=120298 RepID=A0ABS2L2J6_9MICO|nr:LuxR C-terminal-related transcriptional regulator [Subtercola frigoramans]MBM7471310.1 DNA-binding CsgD family transcriptional regulator [Subtercola frigoramans]